MPKRFSGVRNHDERLSLAWYRVGLRIRWFVQIVTLGAALASTSCGPDRASKLPFGALESPPDGITIKGVAFADGWVLSEDGIDHVAIYLDRTFLQDAAVKERRPDVIKLHPEFPPETNARFICELHTESLPVGRHEISARAISRSGATRDLVPHMITIEH